MAVRYGLAVPVLCALTSDEAHPVSSARGRYVLDIDSDDGFVGGNGCDVPHIDRD